MPNFLKKNQNHQESKYEKEEESIKMTSEFQNCSQKKSHDLVQSITVNQKNKFFRLISQLWISGSGNKTSGNG